METGPNEDQMIENAGRSAAMMALQALGKCSKKFPARDAPSFLTITTAIMFYMLQNRWFAPYTAK